jgi:signal transduction histidine kinase
VAEPHRPRRLTVRSRLTLLYGGLFVASGAGLLAVVYLLVATDFPGRYATGRAATGSAGNTSRVGTTAGDQLHLLLARSGIALAVMAVAAVGLGWLMAGRTLRPLRAMALSTRQISETNLHRRLAAAGPSDEITDLADTIDDLLARLEAAFDAQRGFVAHASHELRTPLTVQRALVEVALANPAADAATLRTACRQVLDASRHQERLIEALLALARGQRGPDHRQPVDLAELCASVHDSRRAEAERHRLRVAVSLAPALARGDPRLLEQLVSNLVDNALRHNQPGGRVDLVTRTTTTAAAVLSVTNTGSPVPPAELPRLLQPFQRLDSDSGAGAGGLGIGLSIVAAVATSHQATLDARARPGGGLRVEVTFPARPQ